jgi:hypothetical protein
MARTYENALRDPQIPPDTKTHVRLTCPGALFVESIQVPLEHEK